MQNCTTVFILSSRFNTMLSLKKRLQLRLLNSLSFKDFNVPLADSILLDILRFAENNFLLVYKHRSKIVKAITRRRIFNLQRYKSYEGWDLHLMLGPCTYTTLKRPK